MGSTLGLNKTQEIALNKHLTVGGTKYNGSVINAALYNGFHTNFQGCYMEYESAAIQPAISTPVRIGLDTTAYGRYLIKGVKQLLTLGNSGATAVQAGFPDAAAAGDMGVLRLTNLVVDGVAATVMYQNNALWMAPATDFSVVFDVKQWTQRTYGETISFAELGVVGTVASAADSYDATKVPGYVDGSLDKTSVMVKLFGSKGRLVYKPNASALPIAVTTAEFDIPAGAFTLRISYSAAASNGTPGLSVFINEVPAALNFGSYSTLVVGDLTFTQLTMGSRYPEYTVAFINDGTSGAETVTVVGSDVEVHMDPTAVTGSTAAMIETAWNATAAAANIASIAVAAGQGAVVQAAAAAAPITGGTGNLDVAKYVLDGAITGPLQLFARMSHGAGYVALTHTVAPILDIDSIFVTIG